MRVIRVQDLWPGDVICHRGELEHVYDIKTLDGEARIVFVTPSTNGFYERSLPWNYTVLVANA